MTTAAHSQGALDAIERYEGPAARALVDLASPRPGETVADIGCGAGPAARRAAERIGRAGRVIGIDSDPGTLEVARSLPAAGAPVEWHEASAYALPLENASVDVAVCAQTLQFLDDRPRALSEMRRVLKPGGRAAASLWCDLKDSAYFQALIHAVEAHIGPAPALKAAFALSSAGEISALFSGAGFQSVKITSKEFNLELPRPRDFVELHIRALPGGADFAAAPADARNAVVEEVARKMAAYETGGGMRARLRSRMVLAKN
jgi:ubiquinone/menaquinone biosynthesis C-methylase UbiE